jgi:hypothetical protein
MPAVQALPPPPELSVRVVLPHDFLVRDVQFIKDHAGNVSEIVVRPHLVDDASIGLVAHVVAVLQDANGAIVKKYAPVDVKASVRQGVKFVHPPGHSLRRQRGYKPVGEIDDAAE